VAKATLRSHSPVPPREDIFIMRLERRTLVVCATIQFFAKVDH